MKDISFADFSTKEGQLASVDVSTLKKLPVDYEDHPWTPLTDAQKAETCFLLDETSVLSIPMPKTPEEEEALVNNFLSGMRKAFTPENNWGFLAMLDTSMDYCAQCNSCATACHLFDATGGHEMYRPNFRSEIFRRIYNKYVKKEPFAKWRFGDIDLTWKAVVRLGEMAYRCNLCRRCAQVCPIGVDNGLISRELRKIFSQEMGFAPRELHDKGTMLQMEVGSSTGLSPSVVQETVEFIDEDYSESTGYQFSTPWDVEGAEILLIHTAGEIMAWPENTAASSIIFKAPAFT